MLNDFKDISAVEIEFQPMEFDDPLYIMHMEGHAANGIDALQQALDEKMGDDIKVTLTSIDTLIG